MLMFVSKDLLIHSIILFCLGLLGLSYFNRNYLMVLLFLEVLIPSVNYNLIYCTVMHLQVESVIAFLYLPIIAGVETCIGFSILVLYYGSTLMNGLENSDNILRRF